MTAPKPMTARASRPARREPPVVTRKRQRVPPDVAATSVVTEPERPAIVDDRRGGSPTTIGSQDAPATPARPSCLPTPHDLLATSTDSFDQDPMTDDRTMTIAVLRSKEQTAPATETATWSNLVAGLSRHDYRVARNGPLFCPAEFRHGETRASKNVLRVHFLCLDFYERTDAGLAALKVRLSGLRWCLHTTWSHGVSQRNHGGHKVRVIIAVSRPVLAEEWPRFFANATARFGGGTGETRSDPARLYFLPAAPLGDEALTRFVSEEGLPLDVDAVLGDGQEVAQ